MRTAPMASASRQVACVTLRATATAAPVAGPAGAWHEHWIMAGGRTRRRVSILAAAGIVIAALLLARAGVRRTPADEPPRPNVLVLLVDALRADHLGSYGYHRPTSPTMDALAARGVRFARASSASNRTRSAMPSLWTGLLPSHHGALARNDVLATGAVTAAELLRAQGYATVAHVANPVLTRRFGLDQGWDVYREVDVVLRPGEGWQRHESAGKLHDAFLGWLDTERDPERPFLAWIHYWDVHGPYLPPPGYAEMFPPEGERPLTAAESARVQDALRLPVDDLHHYVSRYDAEIRYVDDRIAELLRALAERGLDRSTYVVLTSDHGEAFLEHGHWDHGATLYENELHVPLVVAGPGLEPRTVERVVSSVDVFATLLELAGVAAPPSDGSSLLPLMSDQSDGRYDREVAVAETARKKAGLARAVRDQSWKLITSEQGPDELFDLDRDPGETRDLLASEPARAAALRAALERELAAHPLARAAPEAAVEPALDAQLRALGYAE